MHRGMPSGAPGQRLLRLLYRFVPQAYYRSKAREVPYSPMLIDVGSGRGLFLGSLAGRYGFAVGVDVDAELVKASPRSPHACYVVASACMLPFRDSCFDTAVFHDSLHHFVRPFDALEEALRVSRKSVLIFDYDGGGALARIIATVEKALGFPASFLQASMLAERYGARVRVGRLGSMTAEIDAGSWRKKPSSQGL
ncbi:class I SAM-dependent methyltransferase [Thermofilum pendens]|nr:class I SAM-dependent methyltransferase [Thermofilum pendens]